MADSTIRALLIEDNPADAILIEETFAGAEAVTVHLDIADTLSTGLERLRQDRGIEVILLDLNLPDSSGLDTLERVMEGGPDLPIVVMTGMAGDELAQQAIEKGAQDYLVKGSDDGTTLVHSIRFAILRHGLRKFREDTDEFVALQARTPPA